MPESFAAEKAPQNVGEVQADVVKPISWYHPHVFNSYPKALPRVTFQDPIVGAGIFYTSGMESFTSTMETNALMGKNVARLIVDDIISLSNDGNSAQNIVAPETADGKEEHVLASDKSPSLLGGLGDL